MGKASRRKRNLAFYIRSSEAPASVCPDCGKEFSGVTGGGTDPDRTQPWAGAPTICAYCGTLLVFDSQLKARKPTPEMAARLLAEYPLVARLRAGILDGSFYRRTGIEFTTPAKKRPN